MKRLLSVILCLCMLCSVLAVAGNAITTIKDSTFRLGDANMDRNIDAKDVLSIKADIAKLNKFVCDGNAADIDADGKVTARDVFYLKGNFVGIVDLSDYDSNAHQVYKFTIGGKDISEYKIYRPSNCTSDDNVYFACEILDRYVREATGTDLQYTSTVTDGSTIVFHKVDYESEQGQKLGLEGYIYEVKNGNLHIYGTYRGAMYAAYEIAEKYLGFRFFEENYTFLYRSRVVDIPEGTYTFVYPEVPIRNVRANMSNQEEHALALHINSTDHGGTTDYRHGLRAGSQFINAHSFGYYYRMGTGIRPEEGTLEERLAAQYDSGIQQDEYSWQPCASSPEEYDIMFSGMLDTITRILNWGSYDFSDKMLSLGVLSMSFSGCDNSDFCQCKSCYNKSIGGRVKTNASMRNNVLPYYGGQYELGSDNYVQYHKEGYSGVYVDLANRAANDIQAYYPGLRVHTILYAHEIPETIRPCKWLNVWYCGTGCNNHWLGSHECSEKGGQLKYADGTGMSNRIDEPALIAWGQFCEESGAELWFWYYPVTYHYYLCGCPNILNLYYDYKYLVELCGVKNLFYEGGGQTYNFETLKGYLAAKMAWEPHMSYEQFTEYMKEYLYMYYGDGYEELYQYILMQDEAGNQCGTCFINNYDRPGDMYSLKYIAEHYEEMRALLVEAGRKAKRTEYKDRINTLMYNCDFLGLSAVYKDWYVNGTNKELYIERCTDMFDYYNAKHITVFSDSSIYTLPSAPDFSMDPMTQIYEDGSRRPDGAWG